MAIFMIKVLLQHKVLIWQEKFVNKKENKIHTQLLKQMKETKNIFSIK